MGNEDNSNAIIYILVSAVFVGIIIYLGLTHLRLLDILSGLVLGTIALIVMGFGNCLGLETIRYCPKNFCVVASSQRSQRTREPREFGEKAGGCWEC